MEELYEGLKESLNDILAHEKGTSDLSFIEEDIDSNIGTCSKCQCDTHVTYNGIYLCGVCSDKLDKVENFKNIDLAKLNALYFNYQQIHQAAVWHINDVYRITLDTETSKEEKLESLLEHTTEMSRYLEIHLIDFRDDMDIK